MASPLASNGDARVHQSTSPHIVLHESVVAGDGLVPSKQPKQRSAPSPKRGGLRASFARKLQPFLERALGSGKDRRGQKQKQLGEESDVAHDTMATRATAADSGLETMAKRPAEGLLQPHGGSTLNGHDSTASTRSKSGSAESGVSASIRRGSRSCEGRYLPSAWPQESVVQEQQGSRHQQQQQPTDRLQSPTRAMAIPSAFEEPVLCALIESNPIRARALEVRRRLRSFLEDRVGAAEHHMEERLATPEHDVTEEHAGGSNLPGEEMWTFPKSQEEMREQNQHELVLRQMQELNASLPLGMHSSFAVHPDSAERLSTAMFLARHRLASREHQQAPHSERDHGKTGIRWKSVGADSDARTGVWSGREEEAGSGTEGEGAGFTSGSETAPHHMTARRKRKLVKTIHRQHKLFELTYCMMLGIRTTAGQQKSTRERLKTSDFEECNLLRIPRKGTAKTPAHSMRDFKFKDYLPKVFRSIRDLFGINPADYLLDVCGNFEFLEFISNSKSGSFFFYSHNRKYMIKTISKAESKFLRRIMPRYYEHLCSNHNTLLTRFFGMHRVKIHKKRPFHFLIMSSVFNTQHTIHQTFDLKGSTFGRATSEKEKKSLAPVFKDNDFTELGIRIRVGPEKAALLKEQLKRDADFLAGLGIMDYSLLLGIHSHKSGTREHLVQPSVLHDMRPQSREWDDGEIVEPDISGNETGPSRSGSPAPGRGVPPSTVPHDSDSLPASRENSFQGKRLDSTHLTPDPHKGSAASLRAASAGAVDAAVGGSAPGSELTLHRGRFRRGIRMLRSSGLRGWLARRSNPHTPSHRDTTSRPTPPLYLTRTSAFSASARSAHAVMYALRDNKGTASDGAEDDEKVAPHPQPQERRRTVQQQRNSEEHPVGQSPELQLVGRKARLTRAQSAIRLGLSPSDVAFNPHKVKPEDAYQHRGRALSIHGLPRRYDRISQPRASLFEAPEIPVLPEARESGRHVTELAVADIPPEVRRSGSVGPRVEGAGRESTSSDDGLHARHVAFQEERGRGEGTSRESDDEEHHEDENKRQQSTGVSGRSRVRTEVEAEPRPLRDLTHESDQTGTSQPLGAVEVELGIEESSMNDRRRSVSQIQRHYYEVNMLEGKLREQVQESLFSRDEGGVYGVDQDTGEVVGDMYFMGIIDILTEWGTKKRLEHIAKSINHDPNSISAVHPAKYAERFLEFLDEAIC